MACKNSICAILVCSYVATMSWQQFLPLMMVLGVAVVFVWRSSDPKKHDHGCNCGCPHDHKDEEHKESAAR